MVTAIGTALIGARLARAHFDKGTRGPALERALMARLSATRPFGVGNWKAATGNWSRWAEKRSGPWLRAALRVALETDEALKNTRITNEEGLILGLTLRIGGSAPRRLGGTPVGRTVGSHMPGATR